MSKARDLANAGTALGAVTATELGYVDGVTSAIQTQIDNKIGQSTAINPSTATTKGDILAATGAGTIVRQGVGADGTVLTADSAEADGIKWATPASGQLKEVVFTSTNASYTIPSGVTGIWALVVGGGGGGGASSSSAAANSAGGGGAGQVLEKYFLISGDTTLNITVGAGGLGATTSGAQGATGSASSIVGNTSATTYATAGGGGGGGGATTLAGLTGASGGGKGQVNTVSNGLGGGGFGTGALSTQYGLRNGSTMSSTTNGAAPTSVGITGNFGGDAAASQWGGEGILIWNRAVAGGGHGNPSGTGTANIACQFGAGTITAANTNASSATANTGAGGNGATTSTTTKYNGGNGGSGLVVLRYVG
jgi:hypothetical protein